MPLTLEETTELAELRGSLIYRVKTGISSKVREHDYLMSVENAYHKGDLHRMRAYSTMFCDSNDFLYIDLVAAALRGNGAHKTVETISMEHLDAYKLTVQAIADIPSGGARNLGRNGSTEVIAFVLTNLDREQVILNIMRERNVTDVERIEELLDQMGEGASVVSSGVL